MFPSIMTVVLVVFAPQNVPDNNGAREKAPPDASPGGNAQALKSRIHKMRKNLLLGGDKVRKAESEALRFYEQKIESIEQGLDSLRADIAEKKASYQIVLDRVMQITDATSRVSAMREASDLRRQMDSLREEEKTFRNQRANLTRLITAVRGRDRDRKVLAAKLESSNVPDASAGIPLPAVGLAPKAGASNATLPIDDGMVADLLSRDPRKGRQVLFEFDPAGYWARFPLQPPVGALRKALVLPPPDPPRRR
jgi:prefoldin subunit 5